LPATWHRCHPSLFTSIRQRHACPPEDCAGRPCDGCTAQFAAGGSAIAILSATAVHVSALAAIHAAAFPPKEAWGENALGLQLALPGAFGLIDERGGMLLGRVAADQAEILTLAVAPAARRLGIATALLEAAHAATKRSGARAMFLEVSVANQPALELYRRFGFTEAGRRRRYYADASDALVLRMNIP
jgi:ribosomal-protein-alanine N-acetyltransferase